MADKEPHWFERPFNDETDAAKSNRIAREDKARQDDEFTLRAMRFPGGSEKSDNPDTAEAMEKQFSDQDRQREREVSEYEANARYRQALAGQQKEIESKRLKDGGFVRDYAKKVTLSQGGDGITASAGPDYAPRLKIGAGVEEIKAVMDMSNAMQRHRRSIREYERREREKKKNDGGLSAARQSVTTRGYFPDRPMFKIGATVYNPMTFEGFLNTHPVTGVHRSAEQGWCQNDPSGAMTPSLSRTVIQAGRRQRNSYGGYGG
jgi:hypothetical protein